MNDQYEKYNLAKEKADQLLIVGSRNQLLQNTINPPMH